MTKLYSSVIVLAMALLPGGPGQPAPISPANLLGAQGGAMPALEGFAHVALRVADLKRSISFYSRLGIHQAFFFGNKRNMTQVFLKVNDRQFIELYPAKPGESAAFLHLCFTTAGANSLHDYYIQQGLSPTAVEKARAGNLLFTLPGPEAQNIEYTQYVSGSLHWEDTGKHLDRKAIAQSISAVALMMADPAAARTFYIEKLGFTAVAASPDLLDLPGHSGQELKIEPKSTHTRAQISFRVADVQRAFQQIELRGLSVTNVGHTAYIVDPDGNELVFEDTPKATATLK